MGKKKNIVEVPVEEQTQYDNFIGKVAEEYMPGSLAEFLGEDTTPTREWEKHWVGMPEFQNEDNPAYKRITISFRTKEDYEEFAKIIDQNLTEKTKSIWHPALEKTANSLLRWIEE